MRPLDRLPYREFWATISSSRTRRASDRPRSAWSPASYARAGRSGCWQDELRRLPRPPYPIDPGSLFVAFYASAELGCHLALNWPMPARILDLFAEFRAATNGLPTVAGVEFARRARRLWARRHGREEKAEMRRLALRGGPYSG